MSRMASFWRNLLRRDRVERDLDDELRATFEQLVEEKIRAGMTPDDARRAARLELGSVDSLKEQVRDARAGAFLDTLLQDLRYGARLLLRNPLFTLTAALSLAIGIGATTAIFTVANGLLLRSAVGVAEPDRLVDIARLEPGDPEVERISYPDYLDVRERLTTVEGVHAYGFEVEPVSLRVADSAERAFASLVSTNYFELLGVPPAAGRVFGAGDSEQPGASPIAVLSHGFWTRRFTADPGIVGETVRLNGHPFTIVGVARKGFRGTSIMAPDLWIPIAMAAEAKPGEDPPLTNRSRGWLLLGARLEPGVSRAQASAEVAAIGAALAREFPTESRPGVPSPSRPWSAEPASPIPFGIRGLAAAFFALLMAIVSVVLVIACANLTSILLTRATVRRREMAVRTAIGAARARVVRQLLTETMLLFVLGGAAGLALARVLTSLIVTLLPAFPVPVNLSMPVDGRVVAFALGLSFVAAVLSGLAPALHASRTDVASALKDDAQGPLDRLRLRNAFVIAQVALGALLVVTAGLLVRGFDRVSSADRGFDPRGVHVASVDLSMAGYTDATGPLFARDLVDRIRALPGMETATLANRAPAPWIVSNAAVTVPGVTPPNGARFFPMSWMLVDSAYFSTLHIPLVAGRDFGPGDREGTEPVAIVGEAAARRFWPGREAVGQVIVMGPASSTPLRVVGVARDVMSTNPLALYMPLQQHYLPQITILARTRGGRDLAGDLRALVTSMDPDLPALSAQTLENEQYGPAETQLRIAAAVAGSVGLVGLLLAAIGVYGVTAYTVMRRTREIGIRLSLGAGRFAVVRLVLRQGMALVAIGSAIGLVLGAGTGWLLAGRFSIAPPDAPLFAGAAVLFAAVGFVACYVPVRRATSIRAMDALRYE